MLKVTCVAEDGKTMTLKLEGRIVGQWVKELREACEVCLAKGSALILDLSDVSFVDDQGIQALKTMLGDRVQWVGCSSFISTLLQRDGRET